MPKDKVMRDAAAAAAAAEEEGIVGATRLGGEKSSVLKKKKKNNLLAQIENDEAQKFAQPRKPWKKSKKPHRASNDDDDDEEDELLAKESEKILEMAREQAEMTMMEEDDDDIDNSDNNNNNHKSGVLPLFTSITPATGGGGASLKKKTNNNNNNDDDDDDDDDDDENDFDENEEEYNAMDTYADLEVSESDEAILEKFMAKSTEKRRTLGDIIMEKLKEREEQAMNDGATQAAKSKLSPQMIEVYTSVGRLLSRYRSGKVPKALKLIPVMRNWEEVLYITEPDNWTPHAMFAATRIFASNLNPRMAQRFYNLVLLPAVRQDIKSNRVLNYHYYMALKKAIYKPAAFFKGILLPLCDSGDCTLKEATIIGSVMSKVSIPMVHSAAAMLKIASMSNYGGATSLFLRVLMDKKYSLPYRVIDAIVVHFVQFQKETRQLPVLWHQCLLVFAQRYKNTISDDQREAFKLLLRNPNLTHRLITPEIRRELFNI